MRWSIYLPRDQEHFFSDNNFKKLSKPNLPCLPFFSLTLPHKSFQFWVHNIIDYLHIYLHWTHAPARHSIYYLQLLLPQPLSTPLWEHSCEGACFYHQIPYLLLVREQASITKFPIWRCAGGGWDIFLDFLSGVQHCELGDRSLAANASTVQMLCPKYVQECASIHHHPHQHSPRLRPRQLIAR